MPADIAAHIEAVASRLLGNANEALSTRDQWRCSTHGSLRVNVGGEHHAAWFNTEIYKRENEVAV